MFKHPSQFSHYLTGHPVEKHVWFLHLSHCHQHRVSLPYVSDAPCPQLRFFTVFMVFLIFIFIFFRLNIAYNGEPKYSINKSNGLCTLGVIDFCNILDDGRLYFENKHMDTRISTGIFNVKYRRFHLKVDLFSISLSFVIFLLSRHDAKMVNIQ